VRHRLNTAFRRLAVVALASLAFASASTMSGCNNEGEGERCTFFMGGDAGENGTDECSSGLVCRVTDYYATTTTTTGTGTLGVCCPPIGVASSALACMPAVGGSTTGAPPTGDGGFDGGADTGADAKPAKDATTGTDANAASDATTGSDAKGAKDGTVADSTLGG